MPDDLNGKIYDRWKTDPDFVHPDDADRAANDRFEAAASAAMDEHYKRRVTTADAPIKPGTKVKWLDMPEHGSYVRRQGMVIGSVGVDAFPTNTYVVLSDKDKIEEVDEFGLLQGWEEPQPAPAGSEIKASTPADEGDIPF